jgi:hypothetical protein
MIDLEFANGVILPEFLVNGVIGVERPNQGGKK